MIITDFAYANNVSNSANQIQSSLTTNFNVTPYYDDYKPESEYYRILFKPGFSVQARELTQLQTMLQHQIKRFGTNIFQNGTIVIPGDFNIRANYGARQGNPIDYVKVKNLDTTNNTVNVASFIGATITGNTSNITAVVTTVADTDGTTTNTKTLYVSYLTASPANSAVKVFQPGEVLTIANSATNAVVLNNDPVSNTGLGSWFQISEGVFFAKDHFVYFPTQSSILERYNPNPSVLVGFYVYEDIVTSSQDSTLLDPALEASNYSAPGADRLRLDPELTVLPYTATPPADFITLFSIANGQAQVVNADTKYNIIGDSMAKRMYDEAGNFVIDGLGIQLQEHENNGVNNGRFADGNTKQLILSVSSGTAYVKGYNVSNPGKTDIIVNKPEQSKNVGIQLSTTAMGNYFRVTEITGTWTEDVGFRVDLYDAPSLRLSNRQPDGTWLPNGQKWSIGSPVGNKIGSAIVHSVQYISGTKGYDAVYNVYLSDITMDSGKTIGQVMSLYYTGATAASGADIVGANTALANTVLQSTSPMPLLYYVGSQSTKTVRDVDGNGSVTYRYYQTATSISLTGSTGNVTVTIAGSGTGTQKLPYGTEYLSDLSIAEDITLTMQTNINIGPLWGAATVSTLGSACTTIHGVGTFFTHLNVGDKVELSGLSNTYYITAIANDSVMTVSAPVPASVTTSKVFKAYKNGDIVNLNGKGVTQGLQRSIYATPTTLLIDMQEGFSTSVPVTVSYPVATENIQEVPKSLKSGRYVVISAATAGTTGPYPLGFSDVLQVRKIIRKTGSAPASLTDGTDITSYFLLDNGQRDNMYDTASIVPKAGFALGTGDYLLVYLDYFLPVFGNYSGYFSINSYKIDDVTVPTPSDSIRTENIPVYISPTSSITYDLRNHLDFRPVKVNTSADATTPGAATTNPAKATTYYYSGELYFPVPSTQLSYSYSYYLPRKDLVVANKEGYFSVLQGTASDNPVPPDALETQMALSVVNLAPYPSLSPAYGNILGRQDLACTLSSVSIRGYTMKDIGVLDNRIATLEYYASLSLLESSAAQLNILDANGLNRFKNGIFVDTLKDNTLSAYYTNPDMKICFDPVELCIRPVYSTKAIYYDYLNGSGIILNNGKITFAYTDQLFFNQSNVTDYMNLERGTFYFVGVMTLNPNQDIWVDSSYAPDELVHIGSTGALLDVTVNGQNLGADVPVTTTVESTQWLGESWSAWSSYITGYTVYGTDNASNKAPMTFLTHAQAYSYAQSWTTQYGQGGAIIETNYQKQRVGTSSFSTTTTATTTSSSKAVGGYKLISSQVIPYIQPQDILVRIFGLKPNSRMHAFFDSVKVDAYVTPLTEAQYNAVSVIHTYDSNGIQNPAVGTLLNNAGYAKMGDALTVNADGSLYFSLKILDTTQSQNAGAPKFQTGQRLLVVVDSEKLTTGGTTPSTYATTWASSYFFANGTHQTLQDTIYSTDSTVVTSATKTTTTNLAPQVIPTYSNASENETIQNTGVAPTPHYSCFNPEAKILMADKTWKAIADINIGEKVIGANGDFNTVTRTRTITVGDRKMVKFKEGFYATDDHLFLTDKGWKTWNPSNIVEHNRVNSYALEGENREKGIDPLDKLKILDLEDKGLNFNYVEFDELGTEMVDFDPDYTLYDLTLDGDSTYIVEGYVVHNCCMAYTVRINAPLDEEGMFVTGFDVFVQHKSPTRGLWFEIRALDSAGLISDIRVPGTLVTVKNSNIVVSPDGVTSPTHIQFDSPIFLQNGKGYAFVIHSDTPSGSLADPDTYMWISTLGGTDRNSGVAVTNRQSLGNLYQTNNSLQWNLIADTDLAIRVYRAKFNTGSTSFTLGQQGVEKLLLSNLSSPFASVIGDHFVNGDTLTLTGVSGTIAVGDTLTGSTSGGSAAGKVITVNGNKYQTSNTRYQIGETVTATSGGTATVGAIANSSAVLSFYNDKYANVYVEMHSSEGGFKANDIIQDTRAGGYSLNGKITDIKNYEYSSVSLQPDVLNFIKTSVSYSMDTYNTGASSPSGFVPLSSTGTYYFPVEKVVYSRSNEVANIAGNRSNKLQVQFLSNSEYTSPLLDLKSTYAILINNLVNNNSDNETNSIGGRALNKYISETITLAEGQDASDLNVYLSNYRPPSTEVLVYGKFMNGDDTDNFVNKNWIQMQYQGTMGQKYSSVSDTTNYIDYTYLLPKTVMTGPNGELQYTLNGTTYTNFKYFAIKIVLLGSNSAVVPKASNLRAIALQI